MSKPAFVPGQPVKQAAGTNASLKNVVQVIQIAPFTAPTDTPLYHVLKSDNTVVYVTEDQLSKI